MAFAYGFSHGMGMGFGLGFLNFIGTILFIFAVFWVIKFAVRGFRGCGFAGSGDDDDMGGNGRGRHAWRGPGGHGYQYRYGGRGGHSRHGSRHGGHGSSHGGSRHRDEALEVARERLARGQINAEEYERLRSGLANGSANGGPNADQDGHQPQGGGPRRPRRDQALEIARMRFATGELSTEEFDSVKRALDA